MANNYITARVAHLHDVESNWNKCPNFIPMCGELIIYDVDDTTPHQRFKIGDGVTTVVALPFVVDNMIETVLSLENNVGYIDAGRITDYQ